MPQFYACHASAVIPQNEQRSYGDSAHSREQDEAVARRRKGCANAFRVTTTKLPLRSTLPSSSFSLSDNNDEWLDTRNSPTSQCILYWNETAALPAVPGPSIRWHPFPKSMIDLAEPHPGIDCDSLGYHTRPGLFSDMLHFPSLVIHEG